MATKSLLIFCEPCSKKRIQDVKRELEKLFAKRRHNPEHCGICNVQLPQSPTGASKIVSGKKGHNSKMKQGNEMEHDRKIEQGNEMEEDNKNEHPSNSAKIRSNIVEDDTSMSVMMKKHYVDPSVVTKGLDPRVLEMIDPPDDRGKPFKCKICKSSCAKIYNFLRHLHIKHNLDFLQEKPYTCGYTFCLERFTCFSRMQMHLESHAADGSKLFKCDLCKSSLKTIYNYRRHIRLVHTAVRKYPCRYCGKLFRDISEVKGHEVIHTNKRPYKCDQCPRAFRKPNRLALHQRIHTGVKPYTCDSCGHTFRDKNACDMHVKKIHLENNKYSCGECQFKCYYKKDMELHKKELHPREKTVSPVAIFQMVEETDVKHTDVSSTSETERDISDQDQAGSQEESSESASALPPETVLVISKLLQEAGVGNKSNNTNGDDMIYHCIECGFQCQDGDDMSTHIGTCRHLQDSGMDLESVETTENYVAGVYRCPDCSYTCSSMAELLNTHSSSHEGCPSRTQKTESVIDDEPKDGVKVFECNKCSFKCFSVTDLRIHNTSHISVRTSTNVTPKVKAWSMVKVTYVDSVHKENLVSSSQTTPGHTKEQRGSSKDSVNTEVIVNASETMTAKDSDVAKVSLQKSHGKLSTQIKESVGPKMSTKLGVQGETAVDDIRQSLSTISAGKAIQAKAAESQPNNAKVEKETGKTRVQTKHATCMIRHKIDASLKKTTKGSIPRNEPTPKTAKSHVAINYKRMTYM